MPDDVVQGLGFLGVRVAELERFEATVALYRDVLGPAAMEEAGVVFLWETQREPSRAWGALPRSRRRRRRADRTLGRAKNLPTGTT